VDHFFEGEEATAVGREGEEHGALQSKNGKPHHKGCNCCPV